MITGEHNIMPRTSKNVKNKLGVNKVHTGGGTEYSIYINEKEKSWSPYPHSISFKNYFKNYFFALDVPTRATYFNKTVWKD